MRTWKFAFEDSDETLRFEGSAPIQIGEIVLGKSTRLKIGEHTEKVFISPPFADKKEYECVTVEIVPKFFQTNPDSKVVWNEETGEWEIRKTDEVDTTPKPTVATGECICFVGKSRYCTVHGNE
jgi:hypothetical protein